MPRLLICAWYTALFAASTLTACTSHAQTSKELAQRSLAASCTACHGTNGNAIPGQAIPSLAGLSKEYLVLQMKAFASGDRPATVMHQLAKGYNTEQIEAIAVYFSGTK